MDFNEGEIIYIDKPLHWTSFDVVKRIRLRILRVQECFFINI